MCLNDKNKNSQLKSAYQHIWDAATCKYAALVLKAHNCQALGMFRRLFGLRAKKGDAVLKSDEKPALPPEYKEHVDHAFCNAAVAQSLTALIAQSGAEQDPQTRFAAESNLKSLLRGLFPELPSSPTIPWLGLAIRLQAATNPDTIQQIVSEHAQTNHLVISRLKCLLDAYNQLEKQLLDGVDKRGPILARLDHAGHAIWTTLQYAVRHTSDKTTLYRSIAIEMARDIVNSDKAKRAPASASLVIFTGARDRWAWDIVVV